MGCAVRPAGTQRAAGRGAAQDLVTVLKVSAAVPGSLTPPGPGQSQPVRPAGGAGPGLSAPLALVPATYAVVGPRAPGLVGILIL